MIRHKLRRIGILTGGGDCPGLNAVIRAVAKSAIHDLGLEVLGIEDGYAGVIEKRGHFLTSQDVSGILTHGGTILGTSNRANPFRVLVKRANHPVFEDQSSHAVRHIQEWNLDALVTVGGDGTLAIANRLKQKGVPVIGIPKTIDNDLNQTDYTFGFDTAVTIATDAIDRLHTTAAAHHRVMILEVMGRNAGWIALYAGAAGGADIILIPELPYTLDCIIKAVKSRAEQGKRFSIIVVAEGAFAKDSKPTVKRKDKKNPYPEKLGGVAETLARAIENKTDRETRAAVLGHIQRGGSPTPFDRNLGTLFGHQAVELIRKRHWGHMVRLKNNQVSSVPIELAVEQIKKVPKTHQLIRAVRSVGSSFGDMRI